MIVDVDQVEDYFTKQEQTDRKISHIFKTRLVGRSVSGVRKQRACRMIRCER